ncbi:neuralized-like protein 4 isoform X1 [Ischnura elegans]|uniref:neuralized-like protein 4 isoform X1 n=2 Tax=Ischnura elegans TaxID=197161 RepID=UPI001ED89335|nr:neuralized-like protein 4 isoform X1 [Ischnura elegans]
MAMSRRSTALFLFIVTAFTACVFLTVSEGAESDLGECEAKTNTSRRWSLMLARVRNESGQWVEFTSTREMDDESAVHITEQLFECGGRKMIILRGALKDPFSGERFDHQLKFHHMTGPNTALINKGYTVVKLKVDGHGPVLTSRPLRSGELFEVRMDKRGTSKGYANGIGVTIHKPGDPIIPEHMNTLKSGTWLFYGPDVWSNNVVIFPKYTTSNIYNLKPGDRMGVMRSETGALHFFVNGVDQGPAASNIPEEVYGVYELYGDATQATILNPTHP